MSLGDGVHVPVDGLPVWKMGWVLAWILRPLICKMEIDGIENIPLEGGAVLASNHTMGPDFFLIAYPCRRQIYYMAKTEAFEIHPLITRILWIGGVFPVHRGGRDLAAIRTAISLAQSGRVVGMYPEGTRSRTGELQRGKIGAARIAIEADVPVIPAVVVNASQVLPSLLKPVKRPTVAVRFGKPLRWQVKNVDKAASARDFTDRIMSEMAAMLPLELRGAYADETSAIPN